MKKISIVYVCWLLASVVAGIAFFYSLIPTHSLLEGTPAHIREQIHTTITRIGATRAYAQFVKENEQVSSDRQHTNAHIMGETLYEIHGTKGISYCDSRFGFGCYHGLFTKALAEGGSRLVSELNKACTASFGVLGTGCQHGIGHGILEYTGLKHIDEALALCDMTHQPTPLLGCTSGVFMEYNTPLGGDALMRVPTTRPFTTERPYEPCDRVASQYRDSCYYELGQWYVDTVSNKASSIQAFCGGLSGEGRNHCFLGIGSSLVRVAKYETRAVIDACASYAHTDEVMCRAGASWMLYAIPEYRTQAREVCTFSDTEKTTTCITRADFTHGMDSH